MKARKLINENQQTSAASHADRQITILLNTEYADTHSHIYYLSISVNTSHAHDILITPPR